MVFRALFGRRLRIQGEANIPAAGPLLLVSNHLSNLDPLLLGGFVPRTLFALAKRELYANPLISWTLAGCNCIPVARGTADRHALRLAFEVLRRGGRLLVFVEGTRSRTGVMGPAEAGVGFLLRRSGAPVLPVGIWGTERALRPGSPIPRRVDITITYGKPMRLQPPPGRDDLALSSEVARHVAALLPQRYRGVHLPPAGPHDHGARLSETGLPAV